MASRSIIAAFGITTLLTVASVAVGTQSGGRLIFFEDFDSEPFGAVPMNLAGPGDPLILPALGEVYGAKDSPLANISVTSGGVTGDRELRMSDISVPAGKGGSEFVGVVSSPAGPGLVVVEFELVPLLMEGDIFEVAVVDNRTTPGTGLIARVSVGGDGIVTVGKHLTEYALVVGVPYKFTITATLSDHATDSWGLRIEPGLSHNDVSSFGMQGLPTAQEGLSVTNVEFRTGHAGHGAYSVDDIAVVVYEY